MDHAAVLRTGPAPANLGIGSAALCDDSRSGEQPLGYDRFVNAGRRVTIGIEYVNMTDINVSPAQRRSTVAASPAQAPEAPARDPAYDLIELMFFAYRDFVGDPDHVLERYQFGRAHHRVLHFVFRHPDIRVADLLDILKITKQSLARVLRELVEQGFILPKEGQVDRRQRLLAVTEKGRELALELAKLQTERFARAVAQSGTTRDQAVRFLYAMIDPEGREDVARMITQADRAAQRAKAGAPRNADP